MTRVHIGSIILGAAVAMPACATTGVKWDNESAATARTLEVTQDAKGARTEVEYHIAPEEVPQAVRDAMDRLHPGGAFDDAEREYNDGVLYYELSRKVNGMEVEAMFTPDGTLFSEEIQVAASAVPAPVQETVRSILAGARVTKWEEIRDAKRAVVEYHVKLVRGTYKYKAMVGTDGKLIEVLREIPAEIEIPVSSG